MTKRRREHVPVKEFIWSLAVMAVLSPMIAWAGYRWARRHAKKGPTGL